MSVIEVRGTFHGVNASRMVALQQQLQHHHIFVHSSTEIWIYAGDRIDYLIHAITVNSLADNASKILCAMQMYSKIIST